jgi:hypothetical protein
MIPNPARFQADALVFRRLAKLRHLFRTKAKTTLEAAKLDQGTGPFLKVVQLLMAIRHPNEWPVCVPCNGDGRDEGGDQCSTCSGAGYLLESPAAAPTILAEIKRDDRSADSVAKPEPSPPVTLAANPARDAVPDIFDPYAQDDYGEDAMAQMSQVRR